MDSLRMTCRCAIRARMTADAFILIAIAFGEALWVLSDGFGVVAVEWVERICHSISLGWATRSSGNLVDDFFVGLLVEVPITKYGNTTLCEQGIWSRGNST